MTACRSFLGVMDKDDFLKIDGTTLIVKLTIGPYTATFDRHGLTYIQGKASTWSSSHRSGSWSRQHHAVGAGLGADD